jgi:excisionase family DNA binding protein
MPNHGDDKSLAEDLLWGAQAIADYLGVSTARVYYLIRTKRLPSAKLGHKTVIASKRQLVRYFEKITREEQSEMRHAYPTSQW